MCLIFKLTLKKRFIPGCFVSLVIRLSPCWVPREPCYSPVAVWSELSCARPVITQLLLSTVDKVDICSRADKLCRGFWKRARVIGRSGSQASLLTSLLSFFPPWPVALPLHDFLPCSLKALSLWKTHLTRGESLKSLSTFFPPFFFWLFHHSSPLCTHPRLTPQGWPLLCRGIMISIVMMNFTCKTQLLLPLIPGLQRSAAVAISSQSCSSLQQLSPPWWLFTILTTTATWRLTRGQQSGENPSENLNTCDEQIKFIKGRATLEKLKMSVVYMRFRVLHRCCFIHDKFSSFNNLDLITDKPLRWRFIGSCKLFEGFPGEGSLRCVRPFFFHFKKNKMVCLNHFFSFLFYTVYLSRNWLTEGGDQLSSPSMHNETEEDKSNFILAPLVLLLRWTSMVVGPEQSQASRQQPAYFRCFSIWSLSLRQQCTLPHVKWLVVLS